ncbi:hypothetical protein MUA03_17590 [Enterobacteriaceae bacterium H16N7]|nr:hypothetical protein [Dryocola clanedunensis]
MQDRTMVKNLLQYLTDKVLTSSSEFAAALEHFSITTTWQGETPRGPDECDRAFFVDVFSPHTAQAFINARYGHRPPCCVTDGGSGKTNRVGR